MKQYGRAVIGLSLLLVGLLGAVVFATGFTPATGNGGGNFDQVIRDNAANMVDQGRETFRFATFGDEAFWGDTLRLHEAIATVSPKTALAVGLKVDLDALPLDIVQALQAGQVNLNDPTVTLTLLRAKAVLGVTGFFDQAGNLGSMGIQCALCHSTVDNSFSAPGIPAGNIGHRLDGWANRDLNVGAIVALAPNLQPVADLLSLGDGRVTVAQVKAVLNSWGPGKFDAELFLDGKAVNRRQVSNGVLTGRNVSAATLLPPAFGLAGVNLHTYTGWGSVTYWNAFVANLEMHGKGTFFDPRLNDEGQFHIAARAGFGNVRSDPDLITSKLGALHVYQLAIPAPAPPAGSFDPAAAERGKGLFEGQAKCAMCHVPPLYTEPGWNMHTPQEIGIDDFQANRAPDKRYRTTPLKGLWTHMKGGFYHDGRFATLPDVIQHYNETFGLGLTQQEIHDLAEYLKSI